MLRTKNYFLKTSNPLAVRAANHWILQRATAIFLIIPVLALLHIFVDTANSVYFDTYNGLNLVVLLSIFTLLKPFAMRVFVLVILTVISVHFMEGIESILVDYVHNQKTGTWARMFFKCIQIEILKCVYIYIFF